MELKARGGYIIGIAEENRPDIFDFHISVRDTGVSTAISQAVVSQLLAYFLAKKERRFAMRQKSYFGSAKERKFEDGVLRVDACFRRHSLPRKFQEQFPSEDISSSFGLSALREERRLQNKVAISLSKGLRPLVDESL